jgi:hypothetical protein
MLKLGNAETGTDRNGNRRAGTGTDKMGINVQGQEQTGMEMSNC